MPTPDQQPATPRRAEPEPEREPRRVWPLRLLVGVLAVLLISAGAIGAYAYKAAQSATDGVRRADGLLPSDRPAGDGVDRGGERKKLKPLNVLVIGSDSRKERRPEQGRSDTLMVLHLSGDRRSAAIISFPRDMYVPIPDHGKNKINSAYALGGSPLAVQTVEKLLDVRMDHVALVSLAGFVDLTNRLGGVTITNTQEFSSHGFHYPKGEITISGKRAMWFVRERKSLADGDLDRAANQRKVMQAIIAKGLSGDTIANPKKFTSFVSGVAENITVDNTMSDQKMRELALSLRMDPRDVKQVQAPLAGYDTIEGVGSVDVVDHERLDKLSAAMREDDLDKYLEKAKG